MDQIISNPSVSSSVPSSFKYASFWRRLFAYFIDGIILGIVVGAVAGGIGFSVGFSSALTNPSTDIVANPILNLSGSLIGLISGILYFGYFWSKQNGQTLGNRLLAIRITHEDGSPLDFGGAVLRYICYYVSAIALGLGFLWVIWDSKKQGFHDKIVKTVVVETGEQPHKKVVAGICGCC